MDSDRSTVALDFRGRGSPERLSVSRESLMELPESVLLCLFPNGVVLSPQRQLPREGDAQEEEEDVYYVEFDPQCLQFVLDFFSTARDDFYGRPGEPTRNLAESFYQSNQPTLQNPLFLKQAIIVLREELEYFAIPPKGVGAAPSTAGGSGAGAQGQAEARMDESGRPNAALLKLKTECGSSLLARRSIFTALQRNVNRENNIAEQHLIDMLCMSGFMRDDTWGYRALEPNRCCIASIALVLLNTGITHPPRVHPSANSATSPVEGDLSTEKQPGVQVNAQQLATAQKLLLFWRKPARKCWWDATDVTLAEGTPQERQLKVWARRVWTLELSLV